MKVFRYLVYRLVERVEARGHLNRSSWLAPQTDSTNRPEEKRRRLVSVTPRRVLGQWGRMVGIVR